MRRLGWWFALGILILAGFPVDSRAAGPATHKPNIVLITLDSTRADRMGFLGAHGGFTPNLDTIARQGIVFAQAYAQAPLTVESHATILTGLYPQVHRGSEFGIPLEQRLPYLPYLLHLSGYRTAAFVGSILLDPANGPFQRYDRGFDVYDAAFHQAQPGENRYQSVARRADQVIARATKWLATNKQRPFFLWVHLPDASAPDTTYDRAVASIDAAAGKLLNFLHAQSLYDDSVIVVAASNGESLGAHAEDTHGVFLYDETVHVPLLVKLTKSHLEGRQVRNHARLLDIAPTILETVGVSVPSQMQGQSLLRIAIASSQTDQPVYARSDFPRQAFQSAALESWRAGKYLYIRAPKPELYDLSADPGATRNLAQTSKATLDTLASQLQALDSRLANEPGKESATALTSSEMQKLASLGYVGLQTSGTGATVAAKGTDAKDVIAAANQTLAALRDLDDGKPEKAIPVLRQVLASHPDFYLTQFAMGAALFQQQHYAEAITYLHKAIELAPESPWAHYTMGFSLMKSGDFKTAVVHLEIASERLPRFSAVHTTLAEVYEHLGRRQDASRERAAASKEDTGSGK
jgi:arylsulfatase A-like enzyme/Tfp pilus assembly protein PilF